MFRYILTFMALTKFSSAINQNLSGMATFFQHYFAGTENLRIISIILLLLAFILFLFLIVILYIKSLLSFIKESEVNLSSEHQKNLQDQPSSARPKKENPKNIEQADQVSQKVSQLKPQISVVKERPSPVKKQEIDTLTIEQPIKATTISFDAQKSRFEKKETPRPSSYRGNAQLSEFDWKTGKIGELDEQAAGLEIVREKNSTGSLADYGGLILDMLGRNIDAGKIAQTVRFKAPQKIASSEDIIQSIASIQNFISLANSGKFNLLKTLYSFETLQESLLSLAHGDVELCLSLMEDLLLPLVEKGQTAPISQKRDILFSETSNYACTFGSLAMLKSDWDLAISAFELAIELSPKHTNAWSRAADAYYKKGIESKAIWAYQNVLSYAKPDSHPHQQANAWQKLSQYYKKQGNLLEAENLKEKSDTYFKNIGIDLPLTPKEQSIIDIIEENILDNINTTIEHLLPAKQTKQNIL